MLGLRALHGENVGNPAMNETHNNLAPRELAWWLHPIAIFVGLNGLTGVAAFLADPKIYIELWRTPKFFNDYTVLLTVAVIVAFSVGVLLATRNQSGHRPELEWRGTVSFSQTLVLFKFSFWLCMMAYALWVAFGVSRGLNLAVLKSVFTGGVSVIALRTYLETVPGVTTCTQFGIAAVVLGCLIGSSVGWRIVRGKLAILFLLALVRALLYSERLAFLELAIPFLVLYFAEPVPWTRRRGLRALIRFAPLVGAAFIYIVFTSFEYFRSWSTYYSARESSLFQFGFWRLLGYYVTSANNSAYLISRVPDSLGAPYFSFHFLWEFPVLNVYVKDLLSWVHLDYEGYMKLLAAGANPEFNNPGGLLSPVVDFGVLGGLAYWGVMGLVTGYLYNLYISKHPLGMCMYPVIYLTLTEVPRYLYWGEGRAFPALAYLLLSAFLMLRSAMHYEAFTPCKFQTD
jgi:oligosaccharide repeat unit polymerase